MGKYMQKKSKTSWGKVANWYENKIQEGTSFQRTLILPNLQRLGDFQKTDKVLDIGCGSGFFANNLAPLVKEFVGVDISPELIKIAESNKPKNVRYFVSNAEKIEFLENNYFDKAMIILAIQNIEKIHTVFHLLSQKMKKGGRVFLVINHPCFRIPKQSEWLDTEENERLRLVKKYMSESKIQIDMQPGKKVNKEFTVSFHRPLQTYFKHFAKNGFLVSRVEEWISNKVSDNGPRTAQMERARHEFPLFMYLELVKA